MRCVLLGLRSGCSCEDGLHSYGSCYIELVGHFSILSDAGSLLGPIMIAVFAAHERCRWRSIDRDR